MARGNRDVELVIRAKNEASKALGAVSSALDELTKAQQKVSTGSDKTSSLLNQLGSSLSKLNQQVGGMSAFDRIATSTDKASAAVARLEKELSDLTAEQSKVAAEMGKTDKVVTHLAASSERLAATLSKQKADTAAAKQSFSGLAREVTKAETALARSQSSMERFGADIAMLGPRLDAAKSKYRALAAEVVAAEKPSDDLKAAFSASRTELNRLTREFDKARTGYAKARDGIDTLKNSLGSLKTQQAAASAGFAASAAAQEKTAASLSRVDQKLKDTRANLSGLRSSADAGTAGIDRLTVGLTSARAELAAVSGTSAQAQAGMAQLGSAVRRELISSLRDAKQELATYQKAWREAQAHIQAAAAGGASPSTSPEMARQVEIARAAKTAYEQARQSLHEMRAAVRAAGNDVTKMAAAQAAVSAASGRMATANRALASASAQAAAGQERLASGARRAASALAEQQNQGRAAMTWIQRLRGEVIALTLAYTGLYGVISQLREATDVYRSMEAAQSRMLVAFGGSQNSVAKELEWIRTEAKRLGIEIGTLAEEYSKFAVATRGSAIEGEETRRIFTAVSEAARVNKLSLDQIKGTYLALTQMVSKGSVSMEELRQQLGERLPGAFTLAARAMNMTGGELSKLISEGKLATDEFLPKFAAELEKTFSPQLANALESLATQIGQFENTKFNAREVFNKGGWIEGFRDALEDLNEFMNSDQGQSFFYNLGTAAGVAVKIVAQLPTVLDEIVIVLSVLAGLKVFNALGSAASAAAARFVAVTSGANATNAAMTGASASTARATGALGGFSGAASVAGHRMQVLARWVRISTVGMTAAERAAWGLNRAMTVMRGVVAALGGLPGLIITGLSVAFGMWLTRTNEVIDAVGDHQRQMMAVLEAYDQAKDKAEGWASAVKGVGAAQAAKTAADLRKQMQAEIQNLIGSFESDGVGRLRLARGDWGAEGQEIFEMFRQLERGEITAGKVRKRLDEIVTSSSDIAPELKKAIENQADLAASAERTERAFADQVTIAEGLGAAVDGVTPAVRSLQRSVEDVAEGFESTGDSAEDALRKLETATKDVDGAIDTLNKMVPELAREYKYLEDLKGIDDIFNAAIATAEVNGLTEAMHRLITARDAAKDSLAGQFYKEARDVLLGTGSSAELAANLLREKEGFKATPYWDVNAYRVGFGSDTVTLADGSVKKVVEGMQVSVADANRDLVRRVAEFQDTVRKQVGDEAWGRLNPQQQAVLTSNAYNYGSLQPALVSAVRAGSTEGVVAALKSQARHNDGINANRRNEEAYLFGAAGGINAEATRTYVEEQLKLAEREAEEAARRVEKAAEYNTELDRTLERKHQELQIGENISLEQAQAWAVEDERLKAEKAGAALTDERIARIKEIARIEWEATEAKRAQAAATKEQAEAEQELALLQQHRRDLMEGMDLALQSGNMEQYAVLKAQLLDVENQLRSAIDAQLRFWEAAMGGPDGEKAAAAITSLNNLKASLVQVEQGAWPTASAIGNVFGQHLVSGVDGFLDKIRETGDVLGSLRDAFLQFASDFLLEIAKMIAQQAILNALKAAFGGGGGFWGGVIGAVGAGVQHTGGVAGAAGNRTRTVSPAWFTNAVRYHNGGIAGLKPNEVPTILEAGEEVLTERDPRHVNNGGGAAPTMDVKVVNAIDAGSFISAGVEDTAGQKAILNFIRANSGAVRGALGV